MEKEKFLQVRVSADLKQKVKVACALAGKNLQEWVNEILEKELDKLLKK